VSDDDHTEAGVARVLLLTGEHADGARFRTGDHRVLGALQQLDDDWMVAVKPDLGDVVPDFLALHATFGVCAIRVCDWTVGAFRQGLDGMIEVRGTDGWYPTGESPRWDALQLRNRIFDEYFIAPGTRIADDTIVRGMVVLPKYTTDEACNLLRRPQMVSPGHWIDVWGGHEFGLNTECALVGDPRMRTKDVPAESFERFVRTLEFDPALASIS
jgi:hypothetical protein